MPETRTPLFLLQIELTSGTQYVSSREVVSPSQTYEAFVVSYGTIETAIPTPCGIPIVSDARFVLAEDFAEDLNASPISQTRRWRDIFSHETPRRRPCKLYALFPGESITILDPLASPPTARTPFFSGEIVDAVFMPDLSIEITVRDLTYAWIDEPIPAMITRDIYPGLDQRYEGQFLPIVCGEVRTPGIDDSPPSTTLFGQIALPRMGWDDITGDRWGVAAHPISSLRVFRRDDFLNIFTEVDPAEYNSTVVLVPKTAFNLSMNHAVIDFIVEQPPDTELRADIDGIDYRGPWGTLAEVGSNQVASPPDAPGPALRNPIDFFINMLFLVLAKAAATGTDPDRFDLVDIAALREKFEIGFGSPVVIPYCDYAITQPMTCREFLGQFLASFNLDMWQKRNGKISLNFTDEEDPDRLVYTETSHILKQTFMERLPEKHVNQTRYLYQRNYAEQTWNTWAIRDTDEQLVVAIGDNTNIELDEFEQWCIRDADTALAMTAKRNQFQALGSFRQEWEMALPEVPVSLEPSSLIGVTHRMGLEIGGYVNREVKVLSLIHTIDSGAGSLVLRTHVMGILRVPQTITIPEPAVDNGLTEILFSTNSPRTAGIPESALWIIPPEQDTFYRSVYSGSYGVWATFAIPASNLIQMAYAQSGINEPVAYADDANFASKEWGTTPFAVDFAWASYAAPVILHGGLANMRAANFAGGGIGSSRHFAIGSDNVLYCSTWPSVAPFDFTSFGSPTQALPTGTWRKLVCADTGGPSDWLTVVGTNSIAQWLGDAATDWTETAVASTDMVDICNSDVTGSGFIHVAVGIGSNPIQYTEDATSGVWAEITAATLAAIGWEAVRPRVAYSPHMIDAGETDRGTFIFIGGKVGSPTDACYIRLLDDFTINPTPVSMVIPDLGANIQWRSIATSKTHPGAVIAGNVGPTNADIKLITNVCGADTYDDWVEKTLAEAPF